MWSSGAWKGQPTDGKSINNHTKHVKSVTPGSVVVEKSGVEEKVATGAVQSPGEDVSRVSRISDTQGYDGFIGAEGIPGPMPHMATKSSTSSMSSKLSTIASLSNELYYLLFPLLQTVVANGGFDENLTKTQLIAKLEPLLRTFENETYTKGFMACSRGTSKEHV